MAGGASVDQQIEIRGGTQSSPHDRQAADKLRDGKFELADQDATRSGDGKPGAARAGRQREGEVGDQQGFAHLGLSTHEQDALRGQQLKLQPLFCSNRDSLYWTTCTHRYPLLYSMLKVLLFMIIILDSGH